MAEMTVKRSNQLHDGSYDYAIYDDKGYIIGEAFGTIGKSAFGLIVADAEANAQMWAKAPDALAEIKRLAGENARLREALDTMLMLGALSQEQRYAAREAAERALAGGDNG
jgi:hypothetical protein